MAEVKRCVQCGMLKDIEEYRQYTYSRNNETPGRYRVCKACESINASYRRAKASLTEQGGLASGAAQKALDTVERTEQLYAVLEKRGLRVPKENTVTQVSALEQLLNFYQAPIVVPKQSTVAVQIPEELQRWLNADSAEWIKAEISPEYLQETVYESLKNKYRPQIGVDKETYLPIYDDTYKSILNDILKRFDDYEEECAVE